MDDDVYRVISIDPGTSLLGFTLWEINLTNLKLTMVDCWTEDVRRFEKSIPREVGKLEKRLLGLRRVLEHVFTRFAPHAVCAESNFLMKKKVTAYRGLQLCLATVRQALENSGLDIELDIVNVIKAKEYMNAASNAKEDVHKKVIAIKDVIYPATFDEDTLGPDALDSIAIGYCYIKTHWERLEAVNALYTCRG